MTEHLYSLLESKTCGQDTGSTKEKGITPEFCQGKCAPIRNHCLGAPRGPRQRVQTRRTEEVGLTCPCTPESRLVGRKKGQGKGQSLELSLGKSSWLPGGNSASQREEDLKPEVWWGDTSPPTWRPRDCDLALQS